MPWEFDATVAASFRQHARQHIPGYDRVIDKSLSLCNNTLERTSKIIDVGCAVGETLERLHAVGFTNLVGVDNSQAMLDRVNPKIAKLYRSDLLPMSDEGYDAVLMNWTLHFIERKREYLDSIFSNLRDGGFLVLTDKTSVLPLYTGLYHEFKSAQGLSDADIDAKSESLIGKMFINDQQWYRSALMAAGFTDAMIIDADWCFTTFLAWKRDA